jgi:hypothetical protein
MNRLLFAGVLAAGLSVAAVADAKSVSFDVANRTDSTLTAIYTGPSGRAEWGPDILEGKIGAGDTVSISLEDLSGCKYDFRYEFTGKEAFEEYSIDVCAIDGAEFEIK